MPKIVLFEFILPANGILPKPSILIESVASLYEHYNFLPDAIATAKGLGGGLPLGAILVSEKLSTIFDKDEHGTFPIVDGAPLKVFYLEDVYNRYEELGKHVIIGEAPPPDYKYGYDFTESEERFAKGKISKTAFAQIKSGKKMDSDWRCLYCGYLDKCWPEKRAEVRGKK